MEWNLTVCSSPSIVKMSNTNRGEQVLAGMVPPQASPPIRDGEGAASSGGSPKRQFFSAFDQQDEVLEEDIGEDFLPQSDQKKRKLTVDQVRFLEESFEMENKLDPERKTQIAKELGLPQRQVAVWFQNRRARSKNKQLEKDYAALKTEYDTVLRENEKLQAEVARLTAQLQSLDTSKLVMKQGGSESWGDGVEILQELGGKTKKQVGVKIEVEVSTDHEVLGSSSSSKCEVVDFFATSPAVAPLKLDDTILSSEQELQLMNSMCNPVLLQQLALKLEGGCLADDSYNLFFAQFWEEPALFPWCD